MIYNNLFSMRCNQSINNVNMPNYDQIICNLILITKI